MALTQQAQARDKLIKGDKKELMWATGLTGEQVSKVRPGEYVNYGLDYAGTKDLDFKLPIGDFMRDLFIANTSDEDIKKIMV